MAHFLTTSAQGGGMTSIVMIVAMIAVFYFLMIRPENKRKKEAEQMRSAVKTGDEIVTIGGIIGTVVNVKDEKIVIETSADQVRIELAKWALSTNDSAVAAAQEEAKKLVTKEAIYNEAKRRSEELVVQTQNRMEQLKQAANEYMDESLRQTEEAVNRALEEVRDTRMKFRSVIAPKEEKPAVNVDVEL